MLLIEDDALIADMLRDGLDPSAFALRAARTLSEARRLMEQQPYDALVLDLSLPDGSGLELAEQMRRAGNRVPILMLTARDTVDARVDGFRHGADDYLCKPFAVEELAARLRAIHRRAQAAPDHVLRFGDIELDLLTRRARRQEIDVTLSARETDLLAYFLRHPRQTLSREKILDEVWRAEDPASNVLNVYVNYLRNKLEGARLPRVIHNVRGVGYIFSETSPEEGA
ncbi:MAG TPA: response regulator transcription factor [Phycisphaerae bacterium]